MWNGPLSRVRGRGLCRWCWLSFAGPCLDAAFEEFGFDGIGWAEAAFVEDAVHGGHERVVGVGGEVALGAEGFDEGVGEAGEGVGVAGWVVGFGEGVGDVADVGAEGGDFFCEGWWGLGGEHGGEPFCDA